MWQRLESRGVERLVVGMAAKGACSSAQEPFVAVRVTGFVAEKPCSEAAVHTNAVGAGA